MPPLPQLTFTEWLMLPMEIRQKLRVVFHIPKTGQMRSVQYNGQMKVESDGTTHQDLSAITLEKIAVVLGEPKGTSFHDEFDKVLARLSAKVETMTDLNENPVAPDAPPSGDPDVVAPKRKGRPPKVAPTTKAE